MQDRGSITTEDDRGAQPGRPVAAVLAVKDLTDAKSRLAPVLSAATRRDLVLAMMIDTVAAARAAGVVDVVVVTPDRTVTATVADLGARAVDDGAPFASGAANPSASGGGPLNRALGLGIRSVLQHDPTSRVIALQADLPTLRAPHLREVLSNADGHARSFVPDRSRSGTAMLILDPRIHREPAESVVTRFGVDSARAHRADGAVDVTGGDDRWPDLRTDVDTVDDLEVALRLGVGPATARVLRGGALSSLGWTPTPHAS